LEKKLRKEVYKDLKDENIDEFENGKLYGMEKFWDLLK
jgi:hypothetical protein